MKITPLEHQQSMATELVQFCSEQTDLPSAKLKVILKLIDVSALFEMSVVKQKGLSAVIEGLTMTCGRKIYETREFCQFLERVTVYLKNKKGILSQNALTLIFDSVAFLQIKTISDEQLKKHYAKVLLQSIEAMDFKSSVQFEHITAQYIASAYRLQAMGTSMMCCYVGIDSIFQSLGKTQSNFYTQETYNDFLMGLYKVYSKYSLSEDMKNVIAQVFTSSLSFFDVKMAYEHLVVSEPKAKEFLLIANEGRLNSFFSLVTNLAQQRLQIVSTKEQLEKTLVGAELKAQANNKI